MRGWVLVILCDYMEVELAALRGFCHEAFARVDFDWGLLSGRSICKGRIRLSLSRVIPWAMVDGRGVNPRLWIRVTFESGSKMARPRG